MTNIRPAVDSVANIQVVLALRRTELALERTQLAWVRTAFAIISSGLALDKGVQALHEANLLESKDWLATSHFAGIGLCIVATSTLAWSTAGYFYQRKELKSSTFAVTLSSPVLVLSILVVIMGLGVGVGLTLWN